MRARSRASRTSSGTSQNAQIFENNCTNIVVALLGMMIPLGNHCNPSIPHGSPVPPPAPPPIP